MKAKNSRIVESQYPPTDTKSIWVDNGDIKTYNNGKWGSISENIKNSIVAKPSSNVFVPGPSGYRVDGESEFDQYIPTASGFRVDSIVSLYTFEEKGPSTITSINIRPKVVPMPWDIKKVTEGEELKSGIVYCGVNMPINNTEILQIEYNPEYSCYIDKSEEGLDVYISDGWSYENGLFFIVPDDVTKVLIRDAYTQIGRVGVYKKDEKDGLIKRKVDPITLGGSEYSFIEVSGGDYVCVYAEAWALEIILCGDERPYTTTYNTHTYPVDLGKEFPYGLVSTDRHQDVWSPTRSIRWHECKTYEKGDEDKGYIISPDKTLAAKVLNKPVISTYDSRLPLIDMNVRLESIELKDGENFAKVRMYSTPNMAPIAYSESPIFGDGIQVSLLECPYYLGLFSGEVKRIYDETKGMEVPINVIYNGTGEGARFEAQTLDGITCVWEILDDFTCRSRLL